MRPGGPHKAGVPRSRAGAGVQVGSDLPHGRAGRELMSTTSEVGQPAPNSAWLVLFAIAFNLTRATGCLASAFHAKATTGTIRAQLINLSLIHISEPTRPY